jgi:hypothetical protein
MQSLQNNTGTGTSFYWGVCFFLAGIFYSGLSHAEISNLVVQERVSLPRTLQGPIDIIDFDRSKCTFSWTRDRNVSIECPVIDTLPAGANVVFTHKKAVNVAPIGGVMHEYIFTAEELVYISNGNLKIGYTYSQPEK